MWKAFRSSLVKCKSKFLFRSLPHYLIFILGLPAGAKWPRKRGLFRWGLFLVHGDSFPTRARR